jgi:hypothetical protein
MVERQIQQYLLAVVAAGLLRLVVTQPQANPEVVEMEPHLILLELLSPVLVAALVMGITQQPFSQVVQVVVVLVEKETQLRQQKETQIRVVEAEEMDFLAAKTAALVLSSSKSQIRIAQSLPEQLSVTTQATLLPLTTHNPLHQ